MSNSKYTFWTWLIAILVAIYIFWQWQHGHGLGGCCSASATTAPIAEAPAPSTAPEAFKCLATAQTFESSGDSSAVAWLSKSAELSTWLKTGGTDWQAACHETSITLTGTVDTEEAKTKASNEAQAFFGQGVTIDNQLIIRAAEKLPEPVAVSVAPSAAKLYFDTGKTKLAVDASATLAPTIEWLQSNPSAKAVISGYHDPSGNQAQNELLAKNRAKAVREALKAAGIDETRIEMRKPVSTEGGADLAEARRVEVTIE